MRTQRRLIPILGVDAVRSSLLCAAMIAFTMCSTGFGAVLLNDTWADGERASINLPTNSPVWIGQSAGNGSNSVSAGSLNFNLPTNSLKVWTYFTSNNSAPDGNQPHNAVTSLAVGDMLTAEASFQIADGGQHDGRHRQEFSLRSVSRSDRTPACKPMSTATAAATRQPVDRCAWLHCSTSASRHCQRQQPDTNRQTHNVELPAWPAPAVRTHWPRPAALAYSLAANTVYTVQLMLSRVSASQLDVTASVKQGNTVLSTLTASDTGTAFGGTAIGAGLLPGSQSPYTNFDHFFIRNSDSTQVNPQPNGDLRFTNFRVDHKPIPEPTTMWLLGLAAGVLLAMARG